MKAKIDPLGIEFSKRARTNPHEQSKVVHSSSMAMNHGGGTGYNSSVVADQGRVVKMSREIDQELSFRVTPMPRLNPKLETYMEGFHPFTAEVMEAQLLDKWK